MMVLFLVFFQIGLFSVGGGYAAMPLIQSLVVESHGWKKWNPILVMLLCGIGGAAAHAVGWL